MRKAQTASVGRFDKAFVALVVLALALMQPPRQGQFLVQTDGVQEDGLCAASQPLPQHDEEDHLPSPIEEPSSQSLQIFEEDAVVHDEHVFVLVEPRLKITPVPQFEPDSLHTSELERPPLRTA